MAEPTYLLLNTDTALTESRVLTANPVTSNIQLVDGGPTSALTIDTVLNLGSLAAISAPGLTTYIGGSEFASRGITSSGSINVTDGVGTTGNIILDVVDSTSTQKVNVEVNNVSAGPSQSTINFIANGGVDIAASINGSQYEVSISATGDGAGTVTSVDAQCNFEGITFSGVPITTTGTIDLNLPTTDTALNKVLGITDISPLTVGWIDAAGGGDIVETAVGISVGSTASLPSSSIIPSFLFGKNAGNAAATGLGGNIGIGQDTLDSITTGATNLAIGSSALNSCTIGTDNIGLGHDTLSATTVGNNNIGIGSSALKRNIGGGNNIGIGGSALQNSTTGSDNVGIGGTTQGSLNPLGNLTTAINNVGVGSGALYNVTIGNNNVGIGVESGGPLQDGDDNVFLGFNARLTDPDYNNCIVIGANAISADHNQICVGNSSNTAFMIGKDFPADGASVDFGAFTTGGVLFPQAPSLPNPVVAGVQVYDTGNNEMQYYNGTSWVPMGGGGGSGSVQVQVFSTPGAFTYNKTVGMKYVCVEIVGGGGSGESPAAITNNVGTSGGGGGYCRKFYNNAAVPGSVTGTVGAGGASVTNGNGLPGTASEFDTMIAGGGGGGAASYVVGAGGTATGGDLNIKGSSGTFSYDVTSQGTQVIFVQSGGSSFLSPQGGTTLVPVNSNVAGLSAEVYGGGGGYSYAGSGQPVQPSGAGANGVVIITEYF